MALRAWKKYISTEAYVDAILQEYAADDVGECMDLPEVRPGQHRSISDSLLPSK